MNVSWRKLQLDSGNHRLQAGLRLDQRRSTRNKHGSWVSRFSLFLCLTNSKSLIASRVIRFSARFTGLQL
jgi:hypothetical protein